MASPYPRGIRQTWRWPTCLLLLGTNATPGAAPPDPQPTVELDVIEVTAGVPQPGLAIDQAANVTVLQGEEKARRERMTLGETLSAIPGVASLSTGGQVGKPVIRGLSGNQIRILSNGIGVDYQQYGERHPPTIDPFLSERIEVVRGASSLLYGSGALGGAIDVQAPAFEFTTDGSASLSGETLFSYRSANAQWDAGAKARASTARLSVDGGIVRRAGANLQTPNVATAAESGDRRAPRFTGELPYTDFDQFNGQFGLGYRSSFGDLGLRYTGWSNENNFLLPDGSGIGLRLRNDELQLTHDWSMNDTWRLKPTLSWQHNLREANKAGNPRRNLFDGTVELEFDQYTARLDVLHGPLGPFDGGTLGLEYQQKSQYSRGRTVLEPGGDVTNLALFAFEERAFGPLTIQAGLRHDWHETIGDANKTTAPTPFSGRDHHRHAVMSGSVGGVYRVTDHLALAANLGRGFRAPTLFELYADGVHGGVAAIQEGNPELAPERSLNTDLSVRWQSARWLANTTVYRNRIDDYIYLWDTGEIRQKLPVFVYRQDDALLTGVEFETRWQATDQLELALVADLVQGENQRTGQDLPLLPAASVRPEVTWRWSDRGWLHDPYLRLGLRYSAAKDAVPGEPFSQFDRLPFGTASTDAYTLADLDLGFAFRAFGNQRAQVDLAVRNLLDEDYRDFLDTYKGYALSPGRDIQLSVRLLF